MKYQKPALTILAAATSAIQGVNPGQGKIFAPLHDGALPSSTVGAYQVDE
jgi:hypothetical protein